MSTWTLCSGETRPRATECAGGGGLALDLKITSLEAKLASAARGADKAARDESITTIVMSSPPAPPLFMIPRSS